MQMYDFTRNNFITYMTNIIGQKMLKNIFQLQKYYVLLKYTCVCARARAFTLLHLY